MTTPERFDEITGVLARQSIELPSWAFGSSGTRFKVFGTPGTPRTRHEKIADGEITPEHGEPEVIFCLDEFGPLNLQPHPGRQ